MMISVKNVKEEMVKVLRNTFGSDYKYYGVEVREGYKQPSFFTQITPVQLEPNAKNTVRSVYLFVITYFQMTVDEADMLDKVSQIREAYGNKVKIKNRYVNVTEFDYEFIGEHADILQVTVTVDFLEDISKKQEAALMREFRMKG